MSDVLLMVRMFEKLAITTGAVISIPTIIFLDWRRRNKCLSTTLSTPLAPPVGALDVKKKPNTESTAGVKVRALTASTN